LKGLDITITSLSAHKTSNAVLRMDAEYSAKENMIRLGKLQACGCFRLGDAAFVTDGIHASIEFVEGSGIKVISAKHPKDNFFDADNCEEISAVQHLANPRTSLTAGDVIVSTVGTIGNAAVARKSMLPANSDRHVGIIRVSSDLPPEFISTFLVSKYGRFQTRRESTGNVQLSLFISKIGDLLVPSLSCQFMELVAKTVQHSDRLRDSAWDHLAAAEQSLRRALGMEGWEPAEPLTYTCRASQALSAARIDAEYFAPRVAQLLARLSADGLTIEDVAPARHDGFDSAKHAADTFRYLEIGGLRADGTATSEEVPTDEAPSRASQLVRANDIITSTVRPIRRLSAIITPDQDGQVCSSGFVVLEPTAIAPEVLLTYLRLPVICELMDLHTSASLYPAISERDLLKLPIPLISAEAAEQIVASIRAAHTARHQAQSLLDRAKRAVELAIEQGEAAGMAHLKQ
jgi:type I restriction enzyme S subunit